MKTTDEKVAEVQRNADAAIERIKAEADRKAKAIIERDRANAEARQATEELRARLERDNGMIGHPKADLLWSKAWEHGHASGLADVECWYDSLIELVK